MQVRNLVEAHDGLIDMEIEHPVHGWIPFTASPDDPEEYGRQLHADAVAGAYGPIAPFSPPPEPTPEEVLAARRADMVVSRFQARAALHLAGLLDTVQALMDDPATDPIARLAWQDAQEFRRTSPTITTLAAALGLTDEQLDDLFTTAAGIDA